MKHQTETLTGDLLNAAVALADAENYGGTVTHRDYSTRWEDGGPLLERLAKDGLQLYALIPREDKIVCSAVFSYGKAHYTGPTYLVAAMRAYVAYKLGDEVELP